MQSPNTVESEYGKGTKFIVTLWQGISNEPVQKQEKVVEEVLPLQNVKLLVVDDNELNCDVAKGLLGHLGLEADIAMSGEECLKLLEEDNEYALILSDHMMPGMDGVELLHRIRALGGKYTSLPIILQTANAISGVREEMLQEGFDDFIAKPIQIGELRQVLAKYIGVEE